MAALHTQGAASALALLDAASDPERTKAAIERIEEKEASAREVAKVARAEITLLEKTRKELEAHAKSLETFQAKSEEDLVGRQAAMSKSEESLKRREETLKEARATLRTEQTTHKVTSRIEMDRLKNLEISLSGREKGLKREQTKLEEQGVSLQGAMVAANLVKADYEARAAKLKAALAG